MSENPFLRLTMGHEFNYIDFQAVSGLDVSSKENQYLVLTDGKVFGLEFVKWLGKEKTAEQFNLAELVLLTDDQVLCKWKLEEMGLAGYALKKSQLTEEYLELESLEIYTRISKAYPGAAKAKHVV